jgi:CheY-like chemotaxis protein
VLIVDDDEATRLTVRTVLELDTDVRHYVVAEAASGQEALDILHAGAAPTVVLLDLKMPGMDGQQMLDHVQADAGLASRCAFVCMTASATRLPEDLTALLDTSGIPLLSKPFDIDDLLAVVAAAADKLPV